MDDADDRPDPAFNPANVRAWMLATPFAIGSEWQRYVDHMLASLSCGRLKIEGGYQCHRCKALWSNMLGDTGYLPAECPMSERSQAIPRDVGRET